MNKEINKDYEPKKIKVFEEMYPKMMEDIKLGIQKTLFDKFNKEEN